MGQTCISAPGPNGDDAGLRSLQYGNVVDRPPQSTGLCEAPSKQCRKWFGSTQGLCEYTRDWVSVRKKLVFKKYFIYLFIFRQRGKGGREGNISVWLPLMRPLLGTWPTTQACALTGNRTGDPLVCRPALNPLGHTSQGTI